MSSRQAETGVRPFHKTKDGKVSAGGGLTLLSLLSDLLMNMKFLPQPSYQTIINLIQHIPKNLYLIKKILKILF